MKSEEERLSDEGFPGEFISQPRKDNPGEPFQLVSDVTLGGPGSSNHQPSYSIEYTSTGPRGEIRHLLADTFKINDTKSYRPSHSSNDVHLPNDYFCGRAIPTDQEEFISIDIQPYLASDVSENGSTIKNYTTFWSRPEMWRATDEDSELYEVTNIENVKHFRALPFDDVRMYEDIWPGTEVGIVNGIIYPNDKKNIYISTGVNFSLQPSGCAGIGKHRAAPYSTSKNNQLGITGWVGFTTVYRGDLIHDKPPGMTGTVTGATDTVIIPRNTRITSISSNIIGLNKNHTYVGIGSTTIEVTIRRIGPSAINREYGYYFRHYDFEDPNHAYDGLDVPRPDCLPGSPGYWQGENKFEIGSEKYALNHQFLSEYTYAFYYGKVPDGHYKRVYGTLDDPTLDVNGNLRYNYSSNGRWGVYIDDEVKNYFEGRVLVGHNIGIGTGNIHQPDPIVSIFNNRWKNQQDEIDSGSTGNCMSPTVTNPYDFMQFQMGLFVEDLVGIGTRIDTRYRLNVDASANSAGIARTTVTKAARFVGAVEIIGGVSATSLTGESGSGGGEIAINSSGINITGVTTSSGGFVGNLTGTVVGNVVGTASGNKVLAAFDIPHAKQKGKRIRHIIAEGPEPGIYVRGKIKDTNVIELPEYWDGLIDPETITVTLTQIGYSQDLIVDKIDLGKNIIIRSGSGTNIHCYYEVWASRWINPMNHDEKLIVVYDGETPDDYPGDNKQFLIGGWDYDKRNPYWEPLDETPPVVL